MNAIYLLSLPSMPCQLYRCYLHVSITWAVVHAERSRSERSYDPSRAHPTRGQLQVLGAAPTNDKCPLPVQ
eukprot:scaffold323924_cov77-Tisochrysis_lutea.AAC.1